jgi:hypothetical protein
VVGVGGSVGLLVAVACSAFGCFGAVVVAALGEEICDVVRAVGAAAFIGTAKRFFSAIGLVARKRQNELKKARLEHIIAQRERVTDSIDHLRPRAEALDALATTMREAKVETVGAVPDDELQTLRGLYDERGLLPELSFVVLAER